MNGTVFLDGGLLDATGAVDMDYGSGNITDHTFISDGGTLIIDGGIEMAAAGALLDATGAVDMDYGSADITDHTFVSDGGTVIIDGAITAIGLDLGSATAEWDDLYLNDGGVIQLGNDQDVTITHVADAGVDAPNYTCNPEAGLDPEGAGELRLGYAAATSVTIADTSVPTAVRGSLRMAGYANTLTAGTTLTLTSAHYGQYMTFTNQAAITVQLPANGAPAGTWIDVAQGTVQNNTTAITVEAATTDTLIGPNDIDLKSVTWGAGHRIGCYARFISDGGFWHVLNLGGTTMTYTD